jgi:outer membrane protein OmpA-like peptidoglycan-associated protein
MFVTTRALTGLAALLVLSLAPSDADAQGFGARLKQRAAEAAKRKVEERTEKKAGQATDAALDKAECAVPGAKCDPADAASANGTGGTNGASGSTSGAAASGKPGEGAWRNYDFVPGERVIFAEDFTRDNVGDFPKRFTFNSGNLEIVEWQGARYLSTNEWSGFSITLPTVLPERFTMEFEYSADGGNGLSIYFVDQSKHTGASYIDMGTWTGGVAGGGINARGKPSGDEYRYTKVLFPVRIMADGPHVKVYMGDTRVANVPNSSLGRSRTIYFNLPGKQQRAAMIGNLRIAAGGRKLYDAIAESGRVATQGIFFDTGSDVIRPESSPTLKEIAQMMTEHADLSLTIEGHTDNVGASAANRTLSQKRADAVKAILVSRYGVDASRLATKGLGDTKPAARNDSAEGRQQNRRVELVKN